MIIYIIAIKYIIAIIAPLLEPINVYIITEIINIFSVFHSNYGLAVGTSS